MWHDVIVGRCGHHASIQLASIDHAPNHPLCLLAPPQSVPLLSLVSRSLFSLFSLPLNRLSFRIMCAFIKIYHEYFTCIAKHLIHDWIWICMRVCTLHTYMLGCLLLHWLTEFFGFRYVSNSSKHSKKNTKIINKFVTNFSTIFHFRLSLFSSNFRVRINERVPVSVCE